ncbi:unnamed protein product, partial [Chrysoparadoxa australica]
LGAANSELRLLVEEQEQVTQGLRELVKQQEETNQQLAGMLAQQDVAAQSPASAANDESANPKSGVSLITAAELQQVHCSDYETTAILGHGCIGVTYCSRNRSTAAKLYHCDPAQFSHVVAMLHYGSGELNSLLPLQAICLEPLAIVTPFMAGR